MYSTYCTHTIFTVQYINTDISTHSLKHAHGNMVRKVKNQRNAIKGNRGGVEHAH